MKIIVTESQLKKIISEQVSPLKVQKVDNYVMINNQKYKLQVFKLGGWKDVDIDNLSPRSDGGYDIKASIGIFSQKDVVPADTVSLIGQNLGKPVINLGGEVKKQLVKL